MGDGADAVSATGGKPTAARPSVRAVFRFGGLVLCGWLVIYILPLGQRPLIMPDETRYAEIPREMLSTGDWVVPRLAGLRYFEKPPLGYWVNAISISLLGEHEFAVRLPSAVAAGLTALAVFGFARTVSRCAKTGIFAAAVYLTFVEVYVVGTFNVLDNLLTLFLTATIIAFHRAVVSRDARFALLAGLAAGGAFLTKGFLGFAIPALVLTPWLLWERRFLRSLPHAFLAVLAAIAISAPWAVLVHLHEVDFWSYFFWEEHIRRFLGEDAQHPEPLLYFVVLLPVFAFPWLCLLPAAFSGQRTRLSSSRWRSEWRLIWIWAVLPVRLLLPVSRQAADLHSALFSGAGRLRCDRGLVLSGERQTTPRARRRSRQQRNCCPRARGSGRNWGRLVVARSVDAGRAATGAVCTRARPGGGCWACMPAAPVAGKPCSWGVY